MDEFELGMNWKTKSCTKNDKIFESKKFFQLQIRCFHNVLIRSKSLFTIVRKMLMNIINLILSKCHDFFKENDVESENRLHPELFSTRRR